MVDVAVEIFGGLHIAFNNAGVFMGAPFSEVTEDMASMIFDINLKSLVFCFKYQVRAYRQRPYYPRCTRKRGGAQGRGLVVKKKNRVCFELPRDRDQAGPRGTVRSSVQSLPVVV